MLNMPTFEEGVVYKWHVHFSRRDDLGRAGRSAVGFGRRMAFGLGRSDAVLSLATLFAG
jgi:hypothetical protein